MSTSPAVVTAHLDTVPTLAYDSPEEADWKPLRHHLGVGAFGVNAWVAADEGGIVIERHDESRRRPRGALRRRPRRRRASPSRGEEIDAPAGTLVFLRRPGGHVARRSSTAPDTLVLAVGAARGEAFAPSQWEARSLRERGAA